MARGRRQNRGRGSNRGGNNLSVGGGPNNSVDRDDDFLMRDVEHNINPASSNQHRGRRDNNNTDDRTNINQNRGDRPPNNRNPFAALINNPFRQLNLDGRTFQDDLGSISQQQQQQQRRNRNRARNQQGQDNQDQLRRNGQRRQNTQQRRPLDQDTPDAAPTPSQDASNHHVPRSSSTPFPFPFPFPTPPLSSSSSSRSTSPARLARFCTECSTVRRANIALRDWCASALSRAVEVLDGWSDEVGVSRGSGDEMDWQPEPVVRVLLLTTPASALAGSQPPSTTGIGTANGPGAGTETETGTGSEQQGQQPYGGASMGNALRGAYTTQGGAAGGGLGGNCINETKQSPRGVRRPETPSPAFSTIGGVNNSVWGNSGSVLGMSTPGDAFVLGQGGVGQGQMDARGSRAHDAFGLHSARTVSPPNTPLSHMIS
ncbi:hypothetical protein F5X97DRAFT_346086 [Nemania serpens]|nr:hypothetical protein F5X97DRAFT_346086 [Nemania serpens]